MQLRVDQTSPTTLHNPSEALFIEPQWDAAIGPPKGVGYDSVLKEEESELIPPLSKRLKRTPPDVTPVPLQLERHWEARDEIMVK